MSLDRRELVVLKSIAKDDFKTATRCINECSWTSESFFDFFNSLYSNRNDMPTPKFVALLNELGKSNNPPPLAESALFILMKYIYRHQVNAIKLKPAFSSALLHAGANQVASRIYERFDPCADDNIIRLVAELSAKEIDQLLKALIPVCVQKYNAVLLGFIFEEYPLIFNQVFSQLSENDQEIVLEIINQDASQRKEFTERMHAFVYNIDDIYYKDALLCLAQIKSRKKYTFNPVLLAGLDEFKKYLLILKDAIAPFKERFINANNHWTCGVIERDDSGVMRCLIIDPMSMKLASLPSNESITIDAVTTAYIALLAEVFPEAIIYFPIVQRQHDSLSCKMFALDDVTHLFTVERYMPVTLFNYLENQAYSKKKLYLFDHIKITPCYLPLSLERTMQTRDLLNVVIPQRSKEERSDWVNKKKETAFTSAFKFFKFNAEEHKFQNTRIEDKFNKMAKFNAFYLARTDKNTLEQEMSFFTLNEWQHRFESALPAKSLKL